MVIAVTGSASLAGLTVGLFGVSRFLVVLSGRQDHRPLRPQARHPVRPGAGAGRHVLVRPGHARRQRHRPDARHGGLRHGHQRRRSSCGSPRPTCIRRAMRGLALGFVATGSLVGIMLSPLRDGAGRMASRSAPATIAIALPWLMMPVLILGGMILVFFVHPDPKEIGMNLERYYPGLCAAAEARRRAQARTSTPGTCCATRRRGSRSCANCAGQGNMAIVMVLTSLVLSHHGYSLTAIAFSHSFHAAGHVRLHHPARLGVGPLRPRMGDVSGRRHGARSARCSSPSPTASCRSRSAPSWSGSAGARPMSPRPR